MRNPKSYKLLQLLSVTYHNKRSDSIAEDSTCFGHRSWRNPEGTHLEDFSLSTSSHSNRRS